MTGCSQVLHAFNCSGRSVRELVVPVTDAKTRPVGSVNGSAPLTMLSSGPRLLCGCFHRRFTRMAGPPVSPLHRRLIVSLARCVKTINVGVLAPDRDRYGVMHLGRPVLDGARLSVLYGVQCGNFGAIGLPVLFRITGKGTKLRRTLARLYGVTRRSIARNMGCVILASHRISVARTTVPSLLTMDTIRRRLVSINGQIRATLVMRDNRVHRIVRTTLLLNFKTDTLGPCVTFTILSQLMGSGSVRLSCAATRGGCVGSVYGNLFGVVDGVNVSAVHSCHNTGVFRTINLDRRLDGTCFKKLNSPVRNVHLRRVTESTVTFRGRKFRDVGGRRLLGGGNLCTFHGSKRGRT